MVWESTSTSPSGRHLGYYHSVMAFDPPPDDDDTSRASHRVFTVLVDSALPTRVCLRAVVQQLLRATDNSN
jgi:hypothetical protein